MINYLARLPNYYNSKDQQNSAAQGINHNWSYTDPTIMDEDILESL